MLKGIHLTLLMGPTIAVPVPQSVINALTGVQVTVSAGQRSGFQLTFSLSKNSLINQSLLLAGFFDPKIRVIIIATINGMPDVLMDGVITRQEVTASNEPGQSTLSVTGADLSLLMDLDDHTGIPYPAMPPNARVAIILAQYALYGIIPLPIPSPFSDVPNPVVGTPSHKGTDLEYIQQLAHDAGYVFYIDPGPAPGTSIAYWGPEVRVGIPQPALNVNMDAQTNVESVNFSFDGLSREQLSVYVQIPQTKFAIPIPVPDISILSPPLAVRQAPALRTVRLEDAADLNPIESAGRALAQAAESADAVSGSGQLDVPRYGRILKARGLVGVRGAGLSYDGLYYVKSVTHNIKRGEYKQSFQLSRNGLISLTPGVPA